MRKIVLLFWATALLTTASYGQIDFNRQQRIVFDKKYGLDVLLHNGKLYYPEKNIVDGHPFWGDGTIAFADIVLEGKCYKDQRIRYDVYAQNFILIFNDLNGAENQILILPDKIDTIRFEHHIFIKTPIPQIKKEFVQLVSSGSIPCYVAIWKNKEISSAVGVRGYSFTKEFKSYYLVYNSQLFQFKTNKDFVSIFPENKRSLIKGFLKDNKLRVGRLTTDQLRKLIEFVEETISQV